MAKHNRSKPGHAIRRVLLDIARAQQALDYKRADLTMLPMEIDALEERIVSLEEFKSHLDRT